jgi:hypothetical protein
MQLRAMMNKILCSTCMVQQCRYHTQNVQGDMPPLQLRYAPLNELAVVSWPGFQLQRAGSAKVRDALGDEEVAQDKVASSESSASLLEFATSVIVACGGSYTRWMRQGVSHATESWMATVAAFQ